MENIELKNSESEMKNHWKSLIPDWTTEEIIYALEAESMKTIQS